MKKQKKQIEVQWIVRSRAEYLPGTDRQWTRFCRVDCLAAAAMLVESLNKTDSRYEFRLKRGGKNDNVG
jgi:hypothetical protein